MSKTIVISGVLGFIFSNFIRYVVDLYPQYKFIGIDKAVKPYNLSSLFVHPNYKFYLGDVADQHLINNIFKIEKPDIVIHGAAESFVDDSIKDITPFLHSNVLGTQSIINASLQYNVERFVYISTDEVYGQLQNNETSWTENVCPRPRNPYSASKYAGELIVYAANQTHGLNYNITRCCNNYGKMQPYRNLVPVIIYSLLKNRPIPIHGNGQNIREWIYAKDNCSAIMKIVETAPLNEIYNIGSGIEHTNLEMIEEISKILHIKPQISFIAERKGHDKRYSVDCSKIKNLGWGTKFDFHRGLTECINWYLENPNFYD